MASTRTGRLRSRSLLPWLVAPTLVLVASCTGPDDAPAEAEGQSPLEAAVGIEADQPQLGAPDAEAMASVFDREQRAGDLIATCMAGQGFEYISWVPPQSTGPSVQVAGGTLEYAETFGFGITTQRFSQEAVGDELLGYETGDEPLQPDTTDPNAAIRNVLDPAEQQAYDEAFFGSGPPVPDVDPSQLSEEELAEYERILAEYEPDGCQGQAYQEIESDTAWFFDEFQDELDELYDEVSADPRVGTYVDDVVACLARDGHQIPTPNGGDLYGAIFLVFDEELAEINRLVEASVGLDPAVDEADEEDGAGGTLVLGDEARERLASLQEQERRLARAVWQCGGGPDDINRLHAEISHEYEKRFVEQNGSRIESARTAAES